ncbi:hypothetical protein AXG93_3536s1030 [Marchantia polymorpha subsp. ruderalis]|uniref:Uncharacterized protein n=1 Tax=Marchantia polymorpha subsp. ruderalis TaxID=1480154 RepID=A0A176VEN6_MARPO|nr:hypothetical protein AXG93_3536s1030 [Marchantia polymorpha subsp. ruderalis]
MPTRWCLRRPFALDDVRFLLEARVQEGPTVGKKAAIAATATSFASATTVYFMPSTAQPTDAISPIRPNWQDLFRFVCHKHSPSEQASEQALPPPAERKTQLLALAEKGILLPSAQDGCSQSGGAAAGDAVSAPKPPVLSFSGPAVPRLASPPASVRLQPPNRS